MKKFLYDIVEHIDMQVLIDPQVAFTKWINDAWTWLIGIVTSHISFHYWVKEQYVQLDIYSCKEFSPDDARDFCDAFWKATSNKTLFITRNPDEDFNIFRME